MCGEAETRAASASREVQRGERAHEARLVTVACCQQGELTFGGRAAELQSEEERGVEDVRQSVCLTKVCAREGLYWWFVLLLEGAIVPLLLRFLKKLEKIGSGCCCS